MNWLIKNLILSISFFCFGFYSESCSDSCRNFFDNTALCFNGILFPNFCTKSCHEGFNQVQFACRFSNDFELRMCVYRCFSKTSEQNDQIFLTGNCDCPRVYKPVCEVTGKSYFNDCFRSCQGGEKLKDGFCTGNSKWEAEIGEEGKVFRPICATSGKTYPNQYFLDFFNEEKEYDGVCGSSNQKVVETEQFYYQIKPLQFYIQFKYYFQTLF